jgi:hypothetical protein
MPYHFEDEKSPSRGRVPDRLKKYSMSIEYTCILYILLLIPTQQSQYTNFHSKNKAPNIHVLGAGFSTNIKRPILDTAI